MANLKAVGQRVLHHTASGRHAEHKVPVQQRMRGHQRTGHAVMRGHSHALRLCLGQHRIGGDDGDGCRLSHPLAGQGCVVARHRRGAKATELGPFFERGGPEMTGVANGRLPQRVDDDQSAHGHAGRQHARRRTDAAFQSAGCSAKARASGPKGKVG